MKVLTHWTLAFVTVIIVTLFHYNDNYVVETARLNIGDAIVEMRSTNRIRPSSYNLQVFFMAKSDEIINIFEPAPEPERVRLLPVIKQMDPGNISKYDGALL